MLIFLQLIASVLASITMATHYSGWILRQDIRQLRAAPFEYIFGCRGSKLLIQAGSMVIVVALFAALHCLILSWTYIVLFAISWILKLFIYVIISDVNARDRKLTEARLAVEQRRQDSEASYRKPKDTVTPRVDYYA